MKFFLIRYLELEEGSGIFKGLTESRYFPEESVDLISYF